jgi:excisionase family DNA binding protein
MNEQYGTTVAAVSQYTGLSKPTIYAEIKRGALRAKKVGKRTVILNEWVDEWLNGLPDYGEVEECNNSKNVEVES